MKSKYISIEQRQQNNIQKINLHPVFGSVHRDMIQHCDFFSIGAGDDGRDISVHYRINPSSIWINYSFIDSTFRIIEHRLDAKVQPNDGDTYLDHLNTAIDFRFMCILNDLPDTI